MPRSAPRLPSDAEADLEPADPASPGATTLRGLSRAVDLLQALAQTPMRPIELCKHLGLPWTSVHRLIAQLVAQHFVEKEPDSGRYRIGQACWLVGSAYTVNHPVLDVARPSLELLASSVDAVVQLCERADRLALTLLSVHRSDYESILKTTYGYHFPLHCGSKGQVLLAFSDQEFIDSYLTKPLEQLTQETITDPGRLREVLAQIREQGYAITEADVQLFTGSLAAPVFGHDGRAAASICVIMRRSALADEDAAESTVEQLLGVARSISAGLGWRPGADQVWLHSEPATSSSRRSR